MKIIKSDVWKILLTSVYKEEDIYHFSILKNMNEHYRLLVYLTFLYDNITIMDLGTEQGFSAIALSQNKKNTIITYDILKINNRIDNIENLIFRLKDVNTEDISFFDDVKIILLDIDPHNGTQEIEFYNRLKKSNFKGFLLCDDINLNEEMKKFWDQIELEKYDITKVGHWSGTGIVNFSNEKIEII